MRADRGIKKEKKTRSEVGGMQAEVWILCSFPRVDPGRKCDFQGVQACFISENGGIWRAVATMAVTSREMPADQSRDQRRRHCKLK